MPKTMKPIDDKILTKAAVEISTLFGNLDDLPASWQNTIANYFYSISLRASRYESSVVPQEITGIKNFDGEMHTALHNIAREEMFIELVTSFVNQARSERIVWTTYKGKLLENVFLDMFKYQIDNVFKKSELRRRLERLFSKRRSEIPDLYTIMKRETHKIS